MTGGITVAAQTVTIGLAQYHKSKADGDTSSEVVDDVINAIGEGSVESIQTTSGIKGGLHFAKNAAITGAEIFKLNSTMNSSQVIRGQWVIPPTAPPSNFMTGAMNAASYVGTAASIVFASYYTYGAIRSINDEDYAYDKAKEYGWNPQ